MQTCCLKVFRADAKLCAHELPKAFYPKTIEFEPCPVAMGWWPFGKKSQNRKVPDVIRRDTRTWLSDLQEICEKNFDNPEEAEGKFGKWLENGKMQIRTA